MYRLRTFIFRVGTATYIPPIFLTLKSVENLTIQRSREAYLARTSGRRERQREKRKGPPRSTFVEGSVPPASSQPSAEVGASTTVGGTSSAASSSQAPLTPPPGNFADFSFAHGQAAPSTQQAGWRPTVPVYKRPAASFAGTGDAAGSKGKKGRK